MRNTREESKEKGYSESESTDSREQLLYGQYLPKIEHISLSQQSRHLHL
jgi:hypothetical protein